MFINHTHYKINMKSQLGTVQILDPSPNPIYLKFENKVSNFYENVTMCTGPLCGVENPPDIYKAQDIINIRLNKEISPPETGTLHIVYFDVALYLYFTQNRTDLLVHPYCDFIKNLNFENLSSMEYAFKTKRNLKYVCE